MNHARNAASSSRESCSTSRSTDSTLVMVQFLCSGKRVRKFFSRSLWRVSDEITAQPQFDRKLRWVDVFGNNSNHFFPHTNGSAEFEEEVRFLETVGFDERYKYIARSQSFF